MSSDLYQYDQISDSDVESDSDAEVEQNTNTKKRQKGASPNLEDFLPSEKRAKFAKKYGNLLSGGRSLQFGAVDEDITGDAAAKEEEEEDPDSDLEILREEQAREASKAQKERQQQDLLQAKRRELGGSLASGAKNQPEETWTDRQLVARSRAWLSKNTDVQEDEDDIEVVLGDTSDEESPFPKRKINRQEQQHPTPASNPGRAYSLEKEDQYDSKSPNFTTAVPSASKDVVIINVRDKAGHALQVRYKTKRSFGKLFDSFREQAASNGWLPSANSECRFMFDGEVVKETDTPASLDLENEDQLEVRYI